MVIRAYVVDGVTGLPVADATWQTQAPKKNNPGTTPGAYTVETKDLTTTGYHWDGVTNSTTFTIQ